ncbi:MAG TPA: malate dehydrogenase [bacterium]
MSTDRPKITVVGAGNVGASCAAWMAERDLGSIVLLDIPATKDMPKGKALDMQQVGPISGYNSHLTGTTDYADTANSDVCVITAGVPRKPGMSREDLVAINQGIVADVTKKIVASSPNVILIIVTNPLDTMCSVAYKAAGLPKHRVIGQAGVLDSARMRTFLAAAADVAVENVIASVIGGHGDEMVPLVRYCNIAGVPITHILKADQITAIVDRTRKGGGELVNLLGVSAWYAPGAAAGSMVEAILKDKKLVIPCSAYLEGEYGLKGMYFGVYCKLGRKGLEMIIEVPLNDEEKAMVKKSADLIQETMKALK